MFFDGLSEHVALRLLVLQNIVTKKQLWRFDSLGGFGWRGDPCKTSSWSFSLNFCWSLFALNLSAELHPKASPKLRQKLRQNFALQKPCAKVSVVVAVSVVTTSFLNSSPLLQHPDSSWLCQLLVGLGRAKGTGAKHSEKQNLARMARWKSFVQTLRKLFFWGGHQREILGILRDLRREMRGAGNCLCGGSPREVLPPPPQPFDLPWRSLVGCGDCAIGFACSYWRKWKHLSGTDPGTLLIFSSLMSEDSGFLDFPSGRSTLLECTKAPRSLRKTKHNADILPN